MDRTIHADGVEGVPGHKPGRRYSPDCNMIERVWWNLHDRITRNHKCETKQELLDLT